MNKDRKILSLERKNAEKQQIINDHERYIYSIDRKITTAKKYIEELEERETYLVSFVNDIGAIVDMDMSIYGRDGVTWELEDFAQAIKEAQNV